MNRTLFVPGIPAPQGSKRHVGHGILVESSKRARPWRDTVTGAILDAGWQHDQILMGPVAVTLNFVMPRLKAHLKPDGTVRPKAPMWQDKRPDVDKLARNVCDALTDSGVIRDDAQIAALFASKCYGPQPGVKITLNVIDGVSPWGDPL